MRAARTLFVDRLFPVMYWNNVCLCVCEYLLLNAAWCAAQRRWPPAIRTQVALSLKAAPFYALLPTLVERATRAGVTRLHASGFSAFETVAFLAASELIVYWVHRALHEVKWLYRHVHSIHHQFKTEQELSPFASMAFMPLDGLLQACPYGVLPFVLPLDARVWKALAFFTGAWSSSIHDTVTWGMLGILGARHHLLHHTHFRCNYGFYTTACDWFFGTLVDPHL